MEPAATARIELARILLDHPHANLTHCFATKNDWKLSDFIDHPSADEVTISVDEIEKIVPSFDTVFLATPAEVSMELAPKLLAQGTNVIDLSGAFGLPQVIFRKSLWRETFQSRLDRESAIWTDSLVGTGYEQGTSPDFQSRLLCDFCFYGSDPSHSGH